jgi:hypothetical protein
MTKDSSRANSVLWTEVEPGHTIDLLLAGATPFGGVVETRTEDGKIIWLNGASAERRLLHSLAEGRHHEMTGIREDTRRRERFPRS